MESTSKVPCITPCRRKQLVTKTAFLSPTVIIHQQCTSTLTKTTYWARDVNSRDRDETEKSASGDRDVVIFCQDETEARCWCVSRPSQHRDVETETTSLPVCSKKLKLVLHVQLTQFQSFAQRANKRLRCYLNANMHSMQRVCLCILPTSKCTVNR